MSDLRASLRYAFVLSILFAGMAAESPAQAPDRLLFIHDYRTSVTDTQEVQTVEPWIFRATSWSAGTMPGRSDPPEFPAPPEERVEATSLRSPAREFVSLAHYPARTTCALRRVKDNVSSPMCTATLVGSRWALTSAHCMWEWSQNGPGLVPDNVQMRVYPAWDDSVSQTSIHYASVIRAYWVAPSSPNFYPHDVILVELDAPIGDELGWVSMISAPDTLHGCGDIAHRFTYPAWKDEIVDTNRVYDGDTLWYRRGTFEQIGSQYHSPGAYGVLGESGSGILVSYDGGFGVIAVTTFGVGMRGYKIDATSYDTYARLIHPVVASYADEETRPHAGRTPPDRTDIYTLTGELVTDTTRMSPGVYLVVDVFGLHRETTVRMLSGR